MPEAAGQQDLLSTGPGWRGGLPVPQPGRYQYTCTWPRQPVVVVPDAVAPAGPAHGTAQLPHHSPRSSPNGPSPLSTSWALWPAVLRGALGEAVHRVHEQNGGGPDGPAGGSRRGVWEGPPAPHNGWTA